MAKKRAKYKYIKDSDADGLPDELEKKLGTNPKKADSDDDGVGDFEEVNIYGTDPLNPDTDGDGLNDGGEIKRGRNPKGAGLLKDLFIPYAGNDFKPQALRPRRLIFYSLSAILLKVILVIAVIFLPIEAWLTPDILIKQSRQVINLTNAIRKNLKLAPLKESSILNQAAFNKAGDMLLNQYFSHTGPDSRTLADWLKQAKYSFTVAGENLAMGFTSPEDVVNGWTRSRTHYQNMVDPDFKEIGVGMSSGLYNKIDTTLVAQYFASPRKVSSTDSEAGQIKTSGSQTAMLPLSNNQLPAGNKQTGQILGEKTLEKSDLPLSPTGELIGAIPPQVDQAKSKLYIDQPQGQNNLVVRAEVYLTAEAIKAQIAFNNYFIDLKEETPGSGKWVGQTIIFKQDKEQIFSPVVLPTIIAEDRMGNKTMEDLRWDDIKPSSTSMLDQYYFIKQNQSPYTKPLFDVTSVYYKFILVIALISLALNILIEIKKQYPHIILSTLGLICLLIVLLAV